MFGGDPVGAQIVNAGREELRRNDHEREEENDRRDVDAAADIVERDRLRPQQRDRAQ